MTSKNFFVLFIVLFLSIPILAGACSSGESVVENQLKRNRFAELDCSENPPVVSLYDQETEILVGKGPVLLAPSTDCQAVRGEADDRAIRRLEKNGEWESYYKKSGALLNRGKYIQGNKEGLWNIYSEEGDLVRTIQYRSGDKEGEEILFFSGSDEWSARGPNHNGMKEGLWKEKPTPGSDCISEGKYSEDEKFGEWKICSAGDSNGKPYLSFRGVYQKGFRTGESRFFHPNGEVMATGNYRINPACLASGGPTDPEKCEFRSGPWIVRYPAGTVAMKGSYNPSDGKKTGVWIEYYQSGQMMARGERKHVRNGTWDFFSKSGELLYRFRFDGNDFAPVSGVLFEDGKKVGEGELSGTLVKYNADADRIETSTIRQQGKWTLYENGAKVGEGEMMMGKKQGSWSEFVDGKWVVREYMLGRLKK